MDTSKNSNGMNPENLETPTQNQSTSPASTQGSSEARKKSSWKDIAKEVIVFAFIAFGVVLPFRLFIAEPYVVDGKSMDPTFATGDYLIVDKLSYEIGKPERNSVVVFKYPNDPSKSFIKRIIGLPGETVVMKDNVLTIINTENPKGFIMDQSYVTNICQNKMNACINSFQKILAENEYFVMGDNRMESFDSRYWGPLNKKYLLGKPILRLLPISKIGIWPGADVKNP